MIYIHINVGICMLIIALVSTRGSRKQQIIIYVNYYNQFYSALSGFGTNMKPPKNLFIFSNETHVCGSVSRHVVMLENGDEEEATLTETFLPVFIPVQSKFRDVILTVLNS